MEDDLYLGASTMPWIMKDRPHFWQNTVEALGFEFSATASIYRMVRSAGVEPAGSLAAK
jgi:hypothetical protein